VCLKLKPVQNTERKFLEKELELLFPTYKGVQKYATRRTSYSFPKMTAIIFTAYF